MIEEYTPLDSCKLLNLSTIADERGNICVLEGQTSIPFIIKRVYYLFDCPIEFQRGGHAHKNLRQLIIALNGEVNVRLDDGFKNREITLNSPTTALSLSPMIWRDIQFLTPNAVLLVLASDVYDENDYIRDYNDFQRQAIDP